MLLFGLDVKPWLGTKAWFVCWERLLLTPSWVCSLHVCCALERLKQSSSKCKALIRSCSQLTIWCSCDLSWCWLVGLFLFRYLISAIAMDRTAVTHIHKMFPMSHKRHAQIPKFPNSYPWIPGLSWSTVCHNKHVVEREWHAESCQWGMP
jgi:hypothetical protein